MRALGNAEKSSVALTNALLLGASFCHPMMHQTQLVLVLMLMLMLTLVMYSVKVWNVPEN
jgi:hypothetical protein